MIVIAMVMVVALVVMIVDLVDATMLVIGGCGPGGVDMRVW